MAKAKYLHQHIDALNAAFAAHGFKTSLSGDPAAYKAAGSTFAGYHVYSPLDEELVALAGEMLWVGVHDAKDRLVAIQACRLIDAPAKGGGLNGILNAKVFGKVLPVLSRLPPVNLAGRLGYLGGTWVRDHLRGRGVASIALKLAVAHAVRVFGIDQVMGFVRLQHVGQALAPERYGFTSATVVDRMYLPGESTATMLCMVWTDDDVLKERWSMPGAYQIASSRLRQQAATGQVKSRVKSRR